MQRIAVTGGIASGKSLVCRCLADLLAAPLLDVDALCRSLLMRGAPGWLALQAGWGERFFLQDGQVNRSLLRERLFGDASFRQQLDAALHPLARTALGQALDELLDPSPRVLIEVPLLYEAGWEQDFLSVVVVYADRESQIRRLVSRDSLGRSDALAAISSQFSLEKKALLADHVVDNTGFFLDTWLQIHRLAVFFAPENIALAVGGAQNSQKKC